jgi:protein TonB
MGKGDIMTANDRFKRAFSSWFWASMILATAAHFAFLSLWPELTAQDFTVDSGELTVIELPPEIVLPPEPEAISRPAAPVPSDVQIDENLTIPPTTFQDNPPDRLPPPPDSIVSRGISDDPTFTPYTVRPDIKNRREVQEALTREYPPLLRDAGIGGTVEVWFQIDEDGVVRQTQVKTSSGHAALDAAALKVADVVKFTPALNRDKRVPVWISLPITFTTR